MSLEKVSVGIYLFKRLHELGVRGVHGVPVCFPRPRLVNSSRLGTSIKSPIANSFQGDFNLAALDLLPDAGLYWVGNCNELNAGKL